MSDGSPCPKCGGWHSVPDPDVDYSAACVYAFKDWRGPPPFSCPTREYGPSLPAAERTRLLLEASPCPRLRTPASETVYCGLCAYEASGLSPSPPGKRPPPRPAVPTPPPASLPSNPFDPKLDPLRVARRL